MMVYMKSTINFIMLPVYANILVHIRGHYPSILTSIKVLGMLMLKMIINLKEDIGR